MKEELATAVPGLKGSICCHSFMNSKSLAYCLSSLLVIFRNWHLLLLSSNKECRDDTCTQVQSGYYRLQLLNMLSNALSGRIRTGIGDGAWTTQSYVWFSAPYYNCTILLDHSQLHCFCYKGGLVTVGTSHDSASNSRGWVIQTMCLKLATCWHPLLKRVSCKGS